tara:strand:+ start:1690 stop:1956 length:267 start_codon:yes stop_codon:yes gene_type:complete
MIDPLLIATLSVIGGAILNTVRGFINSSETTYSMRKFLGAVIVAVFAGIAVAQTLNVVGVGLVELVLIGLTVGFSVDYAVSKAKKEIN